MSKNGLHLITPTSVDKTGASSTATISANGSVSFGSCVTLSLNGVFSADYDNYMIVWRGTQTSTVSTHLRFRASGADNSTASSYVSQRLLADSTTINAARLTQNFAYLSVPVSTAPNGWVLHLYGPNLSQPTAGRTVSVTNSGSAGIYEFAFTHNQSTSYDGFTLFPDASQNFSGRIAVYGMRK